jgi:UPF0755 protein
MKKSLIAILTAGLLLAGLFIYVAADLYFYSKKPILRSDRRQIIITVTPGQNFNTIVDDLSHYHLINFPLKFKLIARLKKYDRKIMAGEYALSSSMTPVAILETLTNGKVRLHRLSIPEGFNIKQIAQRVESSGFCGKEGFTKAATDPKFAQKMRIPAQTFEGYLFPDTYLFPKDINAKEIISAMVKQFRMTFRDEWEIRAQTLGFTMHEIVTLASIIEKETGVASERPVIASVFQNRLKRNMRLESDPTVIYGIKNYNGNITKKDLQRLTPYNTYMITGLPPGPIANPGAESIKAALFPAKTNYLYFVAKLDKTHQFSATLTDHNRAVRKYQLRR